MPNELDPRIEAAREAAKYLRDEADFNRSWTDGRRGTRWKGSPEYVARRIELAEQRERWADEIEALAAASSTSSTSPTTGGEVT